MTDQQINAAIAETCGWKSKGNTWLTPNGTPVFASDVPDYCTDLNAMHEAEEHLSESTNMVDYTNILYDMACEIQLKLGKWNPYGLSARHRAEAFLKTLGKWEEVQG